MLSSVGEKFNYQRVLLLRNACVMNEYHSFILMFTNNFYIVKYFHTENIVRKDCRSMMDEVN